MTIYTIGSGGGYDFSSIWKAVNSKKLANGDTLKIQTDITDTSSVTIGVSLTITSDTKQKIYLGYNNITVNKDININNLKFYYGTKALVLNSCKFEITNCEFHNIVSYGALVPIMLSNCYGISKINENTFTADAEMNITAVHITCTDMTQTLTLTIDNNSNINYDMQSTYKSFVYINISTNNTQYLNITSMNNTVKLYNKNISYILINCNDTTAFNVVEHISSKDDTIRYIIVDGDVPPLITITGTQLDMPIPDVPKLIVNNSGYALQYDDVTNYTLETTLDSTSYGKYVFNQSSNKILSMDPLPPCFNYGTKILCQVDGQELYIPVQDIRKGTLVKTYKHGYKSVALIGYGCMFNDKTRPKHCMYIYEKNNDMIDDLIVTGDHSILVDKLTQEEIKLNKNNGMPICTIDKKYLLSACVSDKFKQITEAKIFTYYHFALKGITKYNRFGVYANGVLVETPPLCNLEKNKHLKFID